MSILDTAPAFRVTAERGHLQRDRGHYVAETLSEFALDAVLAKLAEAMAPGRPQPTKGDLAALVESAASSAREKVWSARETAWTETCACGHGWAEHLGRAGCMQDGGCDCRERAPRRDVAWTPHVLPSAAEVARAYDDEDRHFPQGGGRP